MTKNVHRNRKMALHPECYMKNEKAASIKISETLYHDESSLIEQFIWVTPHCERPSDLPIGPMLRDLAEWWQKSKSKYLK